jgi:mRNA interferase RelE/StbE
MIYTVEFTRRSVKELNTFDSKIANKISHKIQILAKNPSNKALDIKKLKGLSNVYRMRVGNYRVIYEIENNKLIITVIKIGIRGDIYG